MQRNSREAAIVQASFSASAGAPRGASSSERCEPQGRRCKLVSRSGKPARIGAGSGENYTSFESVSCVVSMTIKPARKPGLTVAFGNTSRSSSCRTT